VYEASTSVEKKLTAEGPVTKYSPFLIIYAREEETMPVTSVQKFVSSDGRLHDSYQAAEKHDALSSVMINVRRFFKNLGVLDGTVFPLDLCNKPELANSLKILMDGVLSYHSEFGKWTPAEPAAPVVTATMLPAQPKPAVAPVVVSVAAPALEIKAVPVAPVVPPQKTLSLPASAGPVKPRSTDRKIVKKFDHTGKLLGIFSSTGEAARDVKVTASAIGKACRGAQLTAAGFVWAYGDTTPQVVQ
jgi:hypothetical protein